MKVVVGGTYRDYKRWLLEQKLSPRDAVYVEHVEQLYGLDLKKDDVVRLGWATPDVEQVLLTRIRG